MNSLDDVLKELDERWKASSDPEHPRHGDSKWVLGKIPFKGLNFSIAVMWSPYRIEDDGKYVMNFWSKDGIVSFIEEHVNLSNRLKELL